MVTKRKNRFYLHFQPFRGGPQIKLALNVDTKNEAKLVEAMLIRACRTGDYSQLNPIAREACLRMFQRRGWELPRELGGQGSPTEELTMWRAVELFLRYPDIRACRSRQRYEECIIHLIQHFGEEALVKSIRVPDLKVYQMERVQKAAPATVNWELACFSRLFGVLIELEYVDANPVRMVKRLSVKASERQVYLSFEDVQRIAARCPEWFRRITWTAFYTGMRRGEILGLTWKEVNLSRRMITLRSEDTKEAAWKRIPIHRDLIPVLEECKRGVRSLVHDEVFLMRDLPPHRESLKNPWRRACKSVGLIEPRPRLHDLRHTWKTNARRSKMDPEIRESILGHWFREKSVTERYGRISDEELIEAIDLMTFDHGKTEILASR